MQPFASLLILYTPTRWVFLSQASIIHPQNSWISHKSANGRQIARHYHARHLHTVFLCLRHLPVKYTYGLGLPYFVVITLLVFGVCGLLSIYIQSCFSHGAIVYCHWSTSEAYGQIRHIRTDPCVQSSRFFPDCATIWEIYVHAPCWYDIGQSNDILYSYFICTGTFKDIFQFRQSNPKQYG